LHNYTTESRLLLLKSDAKYFKAFEIYSRNNFFTVCNATYMVESSVY